MRGIRKIRVKGNVTPTLVGLVKVLKQFYPLKWVLHNLGAKVQRGKGAKAWFVSFLRTQESQEFADIRDSRFHGNDRQPSFSQTYLSFLRTQEFKGGAV